MFWGNIDSEYSTLTLENYIDFEYNNSINEQEYIDVLNESIDIDEGFGLKLRPIYIILTYTDTRFDRIANKLVKGQEFWHASMSFGPSLKLCYSFSYWKRAHTNNLKGGLSFESIDLYKEDHPDGRMQVGAIFLNEKKYKKIKEGIMYFLTNKEKTKYDFIGLLYSLLGKPTANGLKLKLMCVTFVDTLLKYANINLNDKQTNLVKADDLKHTNDIYYFKVFEGLIKDYNPIEVAKLSEKLGNKLNNDYFRHVEDKPIEDITRKRRI